MKRTRGQGLIEFALVMPILLLLVFGIFDFSRVLVTYAMASNSLRSGLRQAEVLGYDESDAQFADCENMRTIIRQTFFAAAPVIDIQYQKSSTGATIPCAGANIDSNQLVNGDLLQITMRTSVDLLTPILNNIVPRINIQMHGQRTIVNFISLTNLYTIDEDFDGLVDAWEIEHFGTIDQTGTDDPDLDRCNNGCEETRRSDPNVADTDGDGLLDGAEVYIHLTNPRLTDTDNDLLSDGYEVNTCGTAPVSVDGVPPDSRDTDSDGVQDNIECGWGPFVPGPDYDGDGLNDADEIARGTNPTVADTDGDTLNDGAEVGLGTSPTVRDSDSDGLDDNIELALGTNPTNWDSDGDALKDGDEQNIYHTNPLLADTDGDNLSDGFELAPRPVQDQTSPLLIDTDSDGLDDDKEIYVHLTKPNVADTDGDTVNDGLEVNGGLPLPPACNGLRPPTNPLIQDTDGDGTLDDADCSPAGANDDGDGLPDSWELTYYADILLYDEYSDPDGDGCPNQCEYLRNLNPMQGDSDGDWLGDGDELNRGTNPLSRDSDYDGLTDGEEVNGLHPIAGAFPPTNPLRPNSDADYLNDGEEVLAQHPLGTPHQMGTSNPLVVDTDGDGLFDSDEVTPGAQLTIIVAGRLAYPMPPTYPGNSDSDNDGLSDGAEVLGASRTDPRMADTDGDTVSDKTERDGNSTLQISTTRTDSTCATSTVSLNIPPTNPLNPDTDGDGLADGVEINRQVATVARPTNPALMDTDNDGLGDKAEMDGNTTIRIRVVGAQEIGVPATDPLDDDSDNDCLSDGAEVNRTSGTPAVAAATDPTRTDTDGDSLSDRAESLGNPTLFIRVNGATPGYSVPATNPLNPNSDADTWNDGVEVNRTAGTPAVAAPTDPTKADTDGDTINDNTDSDPLTQPPSALRIGNATVAEPNAATGSTTILFPITLLYPRAGVTVQVTAATTATGSTATAGTGCKNNGPDYLSSTQTLSFTPGVTSRTFAVTVCYEKDDDPGEIFRVVLSGASNAVIEVGTATGTITP